MLQIIIYLFIAMSATMAGSITGMGGGIIIKPLLDILNDYDVWTISVLSSITVLSMSLVSVGKQIAQKTSLDYKIAIPLAIGAAVGGISGQKILAAAVGALQAGGTVTVIQNSILLVLVVSVFLYMRNREKISSRSLSGAPVSVLTGLTLGLVSSFLGIGGGPINVALIMYVFSFNIKTAMVCSIVTILFSQFANVGILALSTGFGSYDLKMLPPMVIGAVAGGFIGAVLNKKLSEKAVENCFNILQIIVAVIAVTNIITYI